MCGDLMLDTLKCEEQDGYPEEVPVGFCRN
jgi:hypothetical protein